MFTTSERASSFTRSECNGPRRLLRSSSLRVRARVVILRSPRARAYKRFYFQTTLCANLRKAVLVFWGFVVIFLSFTWHKYLRIKQFEIKFKHYISYKVWDWEPTVANSWAIKLSTEVFYDSLFETNPFGRTITLSCVKDLFCTLFLPRSPIV